MAVALAAGVVGQSRREQAVVSSGQSRREQAVVSSGQSRREQEGAGVARDGAGVARDGAGVARAKAVYGHDTHIWLVLCCVACSKRTNNQHYQG